MNIEKLYFEWEKELKGNQRDMFSNTLGHRKWCCETFAEFVLSKYSKTKKKG